MRSCPGSAEAWNRQLTVMVSSPFGQLRTDRQEEANAIPGIDKIVEKAKGLIVGNKQPVSALVELLISHAAILHRRYRELEASAEHPVFLNLIAALDQLLERELRLAILSSHQHIRKATHPCGSRSSSCHG